MSFIRHPYFPHILYGIALTSVSMNTISQRKTIEEERNRMTARISILESIKHQLESQDALSSDELDRLKKLAKIQYEDGIPGAAQDPKMGAAESKDEVKWSDIFRGRKPVETESSANKWDKEDIETRMFKAILHLYDNANAFFFKITVQKELLK